ncbi:MAG: ATP-dependent Clp protease ATP-binding subunit [Clostridia bacterium]|nr:ATP-dependent Clp protease ATP-binding subunit [Clostridia bacterium]
MVICSRCKKRLAAVFVSRREGDKTINEGYCVKCAREIGIKDIEEIIKQLPISEEEIEQMESQMENMIEEGAENADENSLTPSDKDDESRAPTIDFQKLFGQGGIPFGAAPRPNAPKNGAKADPKRKFLSQYCSDLTKRASEGKLDRIVGRDRELQRVVQILCRRQKNNPCLIGEPGVGKTALAEALAQHICDGAVPYRLLGKEVHLLDLTALLAGTQFRGQFESRMKGLIEEVKALGNIILVIDEVHSIVGAGDTEGSMNAANILKPALSRGDIQVIGATTLTEYRKYIEKDSALERRFQPGIIEEPSVEEAYEILRGIKTYYEDYHHIRISDDTVRRAVMLSERYITDRFLPDKAIDLLDEASAYLSLNSPCISEKESLTLSLDALKKERTALEADESNTDEQALQERYKRLADLRVRELNEENKLVAVTEECNKVELTTGDLAKVIEIWTGIPASNITEHEFARVDHLGTRLRGRIIGQDKAVDSVVRAIKRNRAGVSYKRKPVSFIFAGPTGVGKTELVKTLANDLFNTPEALIRLDMSEFMEKHSVSRIIGSPPGYVGYDDAGQLTEKIRRKPYTVVLFDEIEKAHPDVLNILLQILDDGRITDAHGKVVNFENTIIIMTTNAGSNTVSAPIGFIEDEQARNDDRTMKALGEFLRPEFINRVDEIITFRSLDEKDFVAIAKIMVNDLRTVLAEKDISLSVSESALEFIAKKSFSRRFGARAMRRYIQTDIEDVIANEIIGSYDKHFSAVIIDSDGEKLTFAYEA